MKKRSRHRFAARRMLGCHGVFKHQRFRNWARPNRKFAAAFAIVCLPTSTTKQRRSGTALPSAMSSVRLPRQDRPRGIRHGIGRSAIRRAIPQGGASRVLLSRDHAGPDAEGRGRHPPRLHRLSHGDATHDEGLGRTTSGDRLDPVGQNRFIEICARRRRRARSSAERRLAPCIGVFSGFILRMGAHRHCHVERFVN